MKSTVPSPSTVPDWRQTAPAGVTLAMLRAAAAADSSPSPGRESERKQISPALLPVVQPAARDQWTGKLARSYDPQRIEQVLRSSASGDLLGQWELFDLMEDTAPRIKKNLNKRKRGVLSYLRNFEGWHEEDQPPTPQAEQRAKLVSRALWTMRPRADENQNGFDDTIYDIMDAAGKGTVLLEIDYEYRKSQIPGAPDWMVAPQCTRWIHPRYYGYSTQGGWLGLNVAALSSARAAQSIGRDTPTIQTLTAEDGVYARLPENKFLVCTYKTKSGHPSGTALLRSLANWWAASNFSQQWFINFAQIFGLPIRWATYDPNTPGLQAKVMEMLEGMGSAGYGAFPAGTTLELKEPMKSGTDNPQASLLDRADKNYDVLILGQSGTTEVAGPGKSGGSYGANKVLEGVEEDIIVGDARFVESVINQQMIPALIRLNYGDDELLPEMCLKSEEIEDTKANAETLKIASDIGMKISAKVASRKLDIPLAADGEEVLEPRAASPQSAVPGPQSPDPGLPARAKADRATEQLITNALENLTGVDAKWLGNVRPFFHRLIALGQSGEVNDAEFVNALAKAQKEMPELFDKMDKDSLAEWFNNGMATSFINGAVRGEMKRRKAVAA